MADIDQIIAGGSGASSRANFSGFDGLLDSFYKGRDQKYQQEGRDLFKGGIPTTPDGQPDFAAMGKAMFQHGDVGQGTALSNLDIQRQQLKLGQDVSARMGGLEGGGQPSPIVSPPSPNRSASAVVAPPLNKGGTVSNGSPQGDQPGSIVGLVSAAGVPDELAGPIIQQVSALTKTDPNASLDPNVSQRVQQVVQAAAQRLKGGGQQQPNPQQNQGTFGAPAATPTRGAIPTGTDPEIQKQIATYTAIASNPAYPKATQEAALTRLKALQDQGQSTGPMKEYDLARRQGYQGTLQDFTAENEAGKSAATERAKADIKEQQEYIDQGKSASQRLTTLNTLSNIISSDKNLTLGFGGETALKAKMALQQLGINVGDLSGAEAIQKLNAGLASEMAKSLTSRTTQFEFKTFLANNPGLLLDKPGNERLIGIFSQLAKREVDLGREARKNQDNWKNWDSVIENYDKKNPMKDPVTGKPLSTDSIVAPGPSQTRSSQSPSVSSKADYDKLPSGAKFTGPDGKPWRKP